jgi:hypothetical protein
VAAAGSAGMSAGAAFLKRATAAAVADRAGARTPTSPNPAAAGAAAASGPAGSSRALAAAPANRSSYAANPRVIASAAVDYKGGAVARVPKQLLLGFIQTWQFDRNVDLCHMKRALATKLVNAAADGSGMVALDVQRTRLHVAQAGGTWMRRK